jgi:hypothetical protein
MQISAYDVKAGDTFTYCGETYTATANATGEFNAYIKVTRGGGGEIRIPHGDTVTKLAVQELTMKIQPVEWMGRTVYRAYYKTARGSWKRYGKYEAASPAQLKEICERLRGLANLNWKD